MNSDLDRALLVAAARDTDSRKLQIMAAVSAECARELVSSDAWVVSPAGSR